MIILGGTIIAVLDDLSNGSFLGYIVVLGSNVITILYAQVYIISYFRLVENYKININ